MRQLINYRPIEAGDCAALARLHLQTFSQKDIEASIFISPLVDHYLAQLVSFPNLQCENWLWGAWDGSDLVGYIFGRALPDTWHLNYLAVSLDYQGDGIGQRLWGMWHQTGKDREYRAFTVDVEQGNGRARAWYERMGYYSTDATWFYCEELAALPESGRHCRLLNWENAEAWQKQYGFSQFNIACGEEVWAVGRLAERYFRVRYAVPDAVRGVLYQVDPTRQLLLMSASQVSNLDELKVSFRLKCEI